MVIAINVKITMKVKNCKISKKFSPYKKITMVEKLEKNDSVKKYVFAKCSHSRYHKHKPAFFPKGILNIDSASDDRKNISFNEHDCSNDEELVNHFENDCSNDEELANHLHINELHSLFKK